MTAGTTGHGPLKEHPTLSALCTEEVSDVVVDPEVLLQHVLPRKGFVTLVTAVALHTYMIIKARACNEKFKFTGFPFSWFTQRQRDQQHADEICQSVMPTV